MDIQQLPKAELHCHLDGSLSFSAIRQLAHWADISLPESDEELKTLVTAPSDISSLNDYLRTFDTILPLLQTKKALRFAAYDVAQQAAKEGVIYAEIRFAPTLSTAKGLTAIEVVEAVLDGFEQAQDDFGIVVKALACGMRQSNLDETYRMFKEVSRLATRGLVGFDFAGNEADFPTGVLEKIITDTQALGLPFTLHAGECGCANNIAQGLKLGIKRFGHATALSLSAEILDDFVAKEATAELCLTSNLQTKAISELSEYPYHIFYDKGVRITINTDNRTVSDTNLTKEYQLFADYFGVSITDFLRFNEYALEASFATPAEKMKLLEKLHQGYAPFLNTDSN
ncbi:adenosine deaminase [Streptococcus sp. E17BB]|uniref:adenosine deaminase n=1 Tax=Streptococcus sp. E17BB TaxID=3278714 RepID=UPI00359DB11B